MRALITGGGGFAGSYLAEYLREQEMEVVAHVAPGDDLAGLAPIISRIHVERADIRDGARLSDILRATKPDHVYHLAAVTSPAGSLQKPEETYDVNFFGTLSLLTAIRESGLDCRFLFVSSPEVYGIVAADELPLREEASLRPVNPYGGSKAACELLVLQFFRSYGLQGVIARPFNHTGPRQSDAFVCSGLARQAAEIRLGMRSPVMKVGNLSASRDFSDVRDIVRGYFLLLSKGRAGEVYQLCSGRPVSIGAVLDCLRVVVSTPFEIIVDPSRAHGQGATSVWGVADKASSEVGWKPKYPLQTTLRDVVSFWEKASRSAAGVQS
jgi:GDP-4-dehydro-6-deoxy-D-mannose reductase